MGSNDQWKNLILYDLHILYTDMKSVIIQAGGQSSRMGRDKGLIPFLGDPLVSRLANRLEGLGQELIITTNRPDDYAFLNLPLAQDLILGAGALGGLYTALSVARYPIVVVVACDMPFVSTELLQAQADLLEEKDVDLVIPRSPEGLEPLHGVYRRETCLPAVQEALEAGERKVVSWFPLVKTYIMQPEEVARYDPKFISFINVNSPEEFMQAETLAKSLGEMS